MSRRLAVAAGAALAALTAAVLTLPALAAWDDAAGALFQPWHTGWPLAVLVWVTTLGAGATLTAVLAAAAALAWAWRRVPALLPWWLAVLGAEATTWALKYAVGRHRPVFPTAVTAQSPSFPSAHAAGAAVVYGGLAWLVAHDRPGPGPWATAAAVVLAIGLSRIALGVHYASDVAGGLLIGLAWVLLLPALQRHQPPWAKR